MKEALKLALEALEVGFMGPNIVKYNQAITAIKEALAQPEQNAAINTLTCLGYTYHGGERWKPPLGKPPTWLTQPEQRSANEHLEPVATDWNAVHEKLELVWYRELSADEGLDEIQDLIDTTPPQRKPLTDEQIQECWYRTQGDAELFARAIEAAHGIKE